MKRRFWTGTINKQFHRYRARLRAGKYFFQQNFNNELDAEIFLLQKRIWLLDKELDWTEALLRTKELERKGI